jgi:hypothetical protein
MLLPGAVRGQEPANAAELRAQLEVLRPRLEAHLAERRRIREANRPRSRAEAPVEGVEAPVERVPERARLPAGLVEWLGSGAALNGPIDAVGLYRRLALGVSPVARACATLDAEACLETVGLLEDPGAAGDVSWARRWYDVPSARRLVLSRASGTPDWDRSDVRRCVDGGGDVCLQVLERWESDDVAPGGPGARASLARFALARGGEDGRARMVALDEGATAAELLSAVSGLSLRELVSAWAGSLRQAHPRRDGSRQRRDRGTALAWASVFAFLAMTNTRWRLGR